jgi:hypothetical protein
MLFSALGILGCLYLLVALFVLVRNAAEDARWRVVLEDAGAALIWPLVLLPWREWLSSAPSGRHCVGVLT